MQALIYIAGATPRHILTVLALVLFQAGTASSQEDANKILGEWKNETADRKIQFYQDTDGTYAAKLSWINDENSDKKIGTIVVKKLQYQDGRYSKGLVYVPAQNVWLPCTVVVKNSNTLEITGGKGFFSKTRLWIR